MSVFLVSICLSNAFAVSKFEGYYEIEASLQRMERHWQFGPPDAEGMPRHYMELKYFSYPQNNMESFFKFRVESNRDEYLTPEIEYKNPLYIGAEGHLKFKGDKWETYLFYRQNRFWIPDEPLLNLVDQDKIKNDNWGPQSSGIRADFWNIDLWKVKGLGGTFIYFDDGSTFNWTGNPKDQIADGTDNLIMRLRKKSFGDRIEMGTMFLRKDWTNTSVPKHYLGSSYNNVYSFDLAFYPRNIVRTGLSLGPLNLENSSWITEYAVSKDPFQIETSEIRSNENKFAFSTEVRNVRISNLILHAWYNNFGENFRDYLSRRFDEERNFNRKQYHIEGIFLVPKKAITATVSYDFYKKRIIDEEGGKLRPSYNLYSELYIEFIKGFKGKIGYNRWHGFDASGEVFDFYTYPNLFVELSVENKLAKVRIQARMRDFGTFREVVAYGYDMEFNATGKLKGYFRILNVNEETEARATVFAQIRYDTGYGAEFFVEYGDPWQSEFLVNTDHFVNEYSQDRITHRIKAFMKIYF
ncbi:MAG: hypothetical protein B6D63_04170 [Candidatus Latescibacteria bacterium 4484_7]|nr:MAG: hypothetical protein B6D63_04170 [Candidatus Latescibacteria bacterium 4484_7]